MGQLGRAYSSFIGQDSWLIIDIPREAGDNGIRRGLYTCFVVVKYAGLFFLSLSVIRLLRKNLNVEFHAAFIDSSFPL